MPKRLVVGNFGDTRRWISDEDGKTVRGHTQEMDHILADVKRRSQAMPGRFSKSGEMKYEGTLSRVIIQDILQTLGKSWSDYATDRDLHAAVDIIYRREYPAFFPKHYQT